MQNQARNYMTGKERVIIVAWSNPVTVLTGQIQYVLSVMWIPNSSALEK